MNDARATWVIGGTGFVGGAVTAALLASGRAVVVSTRSRDLAGTRARLLARVARLWRAAGVTPPLTPADALPLRLASLDEAGLVVPPGVDSIVHLAGTQAVGVRWTQAVKAEIVASRVDTTARLVAALRPVSPKPLLLCASAVGYYGAAPGDRVFTERDGPGDDFLARVCAAWERAAEAAQADGVTVARLRLGVVLGGGGGALSAMVPLFRLGLGGPIGDGRQVVSWISLADAARAVVWLVHQRLGGAFNLVAPGACTQRELATALGAALGRPALLPAPALALRARFGEGAGPLLTGQRVAPTRLLDAGFSFEHGSVSDALAAALVAE